MTVKFKVGFTITGETLFAMIARMLPIENLAVEELKSKPATAERTIAIAHKPKPQKQKRARLGPDLKKGINGIIVFELKDGPKRTVELQVPVKAAGYSPNSVNSRLESLRNAGVLERIGDGRWRMKENQP